MEKNGKWKDNSLRTVKGNSRGRHRFLPATFLVAKKHSLVPKTAFSGLPRKTDCQFSYHLLLTARILKLRLNTNVIIWSNSYHKGTLFFLWLSTVEFNFFFNPIWNGPKYVTFLCFIGVQIFEFCKLESYSGIQLTEPDCKMLQFWSCNPII